MPSHTHIQNAHSHTYSRAINTGFRHANDNTQIAYFHTYDSPATSSVTATNQNTGGGIAHPITQPTMIVNYIIKL
jgi:microcystin-dependent protein